MFRRAAAAIIALLSLGCVNQLDVDAETGLAASQDEGSVIVGSLGWTDVTLLESDSPARENSRAVGYLSIPARGQRCTAFVVAPDVVMTNEHCIPADWAAEGATVSFRRESGVPASQRLSFDCSVFLGNDPGLDFALLQCAGRPGDVVGVLPLEARTVSTGEPLYVVHQNCDYYAAPGCDPVKQYSAGKVTRVAQEVAHDADTLGGSSGAPVFHGGAHTVFALHHVGVGNRGDGRGVENRAVPMSAILPVLNERFPWLELATEVTPGVTMDPPAGPSEESDSFEPNDSGAEAPLVGLPFAALSLAIGSSDDRDLFVFYTEGGERGIRMDLTSGAGDLDLYLWSASGTLLAQSAGTTAVEEIRQELPAGHYIVDVRGYQGAQGAYSLRIQ